MIQIETILNVADNSGAKTVKCIKVLNKKKVANIGDTILVSIRTLKTGASGGQGSNTSGKRAHGKSNKTLIKKGQIYKALIIRTKRGISKAERNYGNTIKFTTNDVVLLITGSKNQENLLGTRIFGPITRELRAKNYKKVISQAKGMI